MKKPSQRELKERRLKLRGNMTPAEDLLWSLLRNRSLSNRKFRRQHPIDSYIADFYCHQECLVVELDGCHHDKDPDIIEYDKRRTAYFEKLGLKVLRFENELVLKHSNYVLNEIKKSFNK